MNLRYRRLWLWVEGPDDERFARYVLEPLLKQRYDQIDIVQYAERSKKYVDSLMKSIEAMGADYLLLGDKDKSPCITGAKERICKQYRSVSWERIVVVLPEIEGWYVAGLDDASWQALGLGPRVHSDSVNKERFDDIVGGKKEHISAMVEILKSYNSVTAKRHNLSFAYFHGKHIVKA